MSAAQIFRYEKMNIDFEKVSSPPYVGFFLVVVSAAFQIGYFREIGIEFITFLGAVDILISAAFASTAFLPLIWLSEIALGRSSTQLSSGSRHWSSIIPYSSLLESFVDWTAASLLRWMVVWVAVTVAALYVLFFVDHAITALDIIFIALISIFSIWNLSIIIIQMEENGEAPVRTLYFFLFNVAIASMLVGDFYATHLAGKSCSVRTSDGAFSAIFLRSVGSGIIIRYENQMVYMAESEVKGIICEKLIKSAGE